MRNGRSHAVSDMQRTKKKNERELFWQDHRAHTSTVRDIFDRLFYSAQKDITKEGESDVGTIWNDLDREEVIVRELEKVGFADPRRAYENLLAVRDGEVYAPPSPKSLKAMRSLGPALITEIAKSSAPDQALLNLAKFSHRLGGTDRISHSFGRESGNHASAYYFICRKPIFNRPVLEST